MNFNNGSVLNTLKNSNNVIGERSNFIECMCYDLENKKWVFKQIDIREPIDRFIPEYIFMEQIKD